MYTAVIMILFLGGPVTFSLNPPMPADSMAQCEEYLDLLEERIMRQAPSLAHQFGMPSDMQRECLTTEEALRHPGLDAETKASVGEPA